MDVDVIGRQLIKLVVGTDANPSATRTRMKLAGLHNPSE